MTLFLSQWKKYLTFAALLSSFVNILQLTFPFYMFTIYRNIIISYSPSSLANITAAAGIAVLALLFFSYLRARLLAAAGRDLHQTLQKTVYAGMVKAMVLHPEKAYRGGISDLDTLQNFCSSPGIYALFDVMWAPFYLALIYLFHPVLGLIATLGAFVMAGLSLLQEMLIRKDMGQANQLNMTNQRFVDSFLRNVDVINGMGMAPAVTDRFLHNNDKVMASQTRSSYVAGTIQAAIKPAQIVIQVLIYCFGAYYAMTQGFDVGLMVAGSIIMGRGLAPLMQLMGSWRMARHAWEAFNRIRNVTRAGGQEMAPPMPLPVPAGRIQADGALFVMNGQVLLSQVSFDLSPGQFLGIIGPSGAGKTTLCRLLLGIWPSFGGKVYLDGRDVFASDKQQIGHVIGYLPQEVELFPGTVAENIARLEIPDRKALEKVMDLAQCRDLVESLPDGLDTHLGGMEDMQLSGGQKQKIGLARALYRNPVFLVLDEPSSSLDEASETQLMDTLTQIKTAGKTTCVMVAHKPALLQSMDSILVLRNGQMAMFGPKDAVFARLSDGRAA
ncbi:type I secretion system permease/ATPase [Desulfotignum phosphitoxidans]|uniref:Alkaline protease secretion ATP-binding protein AprD n=1 Tax=Desulfotignum phosphitoxidans DSM 13687 TaxID=1286635 RepID=S0FZD7_9BACT|nr:ATP-binding cassette domain-containing protein [Desulfotignum phosphitoxidans]EMS80498.1 alkaline protease secretion ATP-binding protein AprD [Desulfotignum phosphitoxidans DSM 13687]